MKQRASCRRCSGYVSLNADGDPRCLQCGRPYRQPAPSIKPRDVGLVSCVACKEAYFLVRGHYCPLVLYRDRLQVACADCGAPSWRKRCPVCKQARRLAAGRCERMKAKLRRTLFAMHCARKVAHFLARGCAGGRGAWRRPVGAQHCHCGHAGVSQRAAAA